MVVPIRAQTYLPRISILLIIMVAVASAVTALIASGILTRNIRVPNSGQVKTIGIGAYQDSQCQIPLQSIDWGDLLPGDQKSRTIYLKNEGNVTIILTHTVGNWTPTEAQNYLNLTWNRENYVVHPNEIINATLTLTVNATAPGFGSFTFDLMIIGTEQVEA